MVTLMGSFWLEVREPLQRGPIKPMESVVLGEVVVVPDRPVTSESFALTDATCMR